MKKVKEAHVSTTGQPMGDYYGTGVKNKIGRMRGDSPGMIPVPKSKLKKPPKSLA
jgi:hypothetical protein